MGNESELSPEIKALWGQLHEHARHEYLRLSNDPETIGEDLNSGEKIRLGIGLIGIGIKETVLGAVDRFRNRNR